MKYHKLISDARLDIWLLSSDLTDDVLQAVQKTPMCKHKGLFGPRWVTDSLFPAPAAWQVGTS